MPLSSARGEGETFCPACQLHMSIYLDATKIAISKCRLVKLVFRMPIGGVGLWGFAHVGGGGGEGTASWQGRTMALLQLHEKQFQTYRGEIVSLEPGADDFWALVSEPGFLHFSKMFRKFGILGEFLKIVYKNVSAQYRRINIGRLLENWFPIRRLMEAKNKPETFD